MTNVAEKIKIKWASISESMHFINEKNRDEFMDTELSSFAKQAMDEKLEITRNKGRGGWWTKDCSTEQLKQMLREHIDKGDMRDVMNLAAMIYYRESAGIK